MQRGARRVARCMHGVRCGAAACRPNERTLELMDRITARLMREKAWDQAVFNEEIWKPSSAKYKGSHVRARIMEMDVFMNSKRLFRCVWGMGRWGAGKKATTPSKRARGGGHCT